MTRADKKIDRLAKIVHEANRAYCETQGDHSQKSWKDTPEDLRESTRDGVRNIIDNPSITPEQSHENWMKFKASQGWKYGEKKDHEKKEHPSMVPYDKLSSVDKFKDTLFHSIVHGYLQFINK